MRLSLKAVNTFVDSSPTWKNHRIDYIAASFHLQVANAGTFVEVDLATTEREDHRPVFAEIVLAPAPFVSPKRQGLKYSRDKLQDPSCCAAF